jgi:hypothetical protein
MSGISSFPGLCITDTVLKASYVFSRVVSSLSQRDDYQKLMDINGQVENLRLT